MTGDLKKTEGDLSGTFSHDSQPSKPISSKTLKPTRRSSMEYASSGRLFLPPRPLPPLGAITSHIRSFVPGCLHGACRFEASPYGTSQPVCSRKSTLRSDWDVPVCRAELLVCVGLWKCGYVNICSHGLRTSRRCAPACNHNHLSTVRTTLGRCCSRSISVTVSTRQQGDAVREKERSLRTRSWWSCVHIHPYRRQHLVVALHQQRAQLLPAQVVQLVLPQDPPVVFRVQLMGEAAPSTVNKTERFSLSYRLNLQSHKVFFFF